jgi:AbrB family looped-hinge helix DNA binding protein
MNMSESKNGERTESADERSETVSVSSSGQATIPKRFRDKLGIDAPGQVVFRETEDGEIVVKRVPSAEEMRGITSRSGEASTDKTASELLREKRAADKSERDSE